MRSEGPVTGVAVAPAAPGANFDTGQTDEQPASSWGFDPSSSDAVVDDLAAADMIQDGPTDVVAAPVPPEGS